MRQVQEGSTMTMTTRRIAAGVMTTVVMAGLGVAATGSPAHAISCGSTGPDVTVNARYLEVDISYRGPRTVALILRTGRVFDDSSAFLGGIDGTGIQQGDEIWVERRATTTAPWERCPSSTAAHDNQTQVNSRGTDNAGYYMRACLRYWATAVYRSTVCTSSYYDT
jgi:hypothetical protein